jgi:outer membrane protein
MIRSSSAVAVAAAALLFAAPAAAARYSREQLIARVEAAHPRLAAARQNLETARINLKATQLGWAPTGQLTLQVGGTPEIRCEAPDVPPGGGTRLYREQHCLNTSYVDWARPGRGSGWWNAAPIHGVLVGVSLNLQQPLYTFGKLEAQIDSAEAGVGNAEQLIASARADAVQAALRAYWGVQWGRSSLAVIDEELRKLKAWTRSIEDDMDGDNLARYSEADLARLKVTTDFIELQRLDIERRLTVAVAELRTASHDATADVDDDELALEADSRPLEWYAELARRRRPEAKLYDMSVRAADANKKARLADMLPDLNIINSVNFSYASAEDSPLSYYLLRNTTFDGQWIVQFHVAYDFGPRYTKLQQARHEQRAAVLKRDKGLLDIDVEVKRSWADHKEALEREATLRHGERVAHGWYAIVDDNLQRGLSVSSDTRELSDAARNYFDFRLRHLGAVLDANLTLAALGRASGSP